jgi:hypothetical protein
MRRTLRSVIGIAGLTLGLGLAVGAPTHASPDPSGDIGALDPEGESGDYDIEAAAAEFEALAVIAVAPGTTSGSSKLTGPCGGYAHSYGEDGELIDSAIDLGDGSPPIDLMGGGQAFTSGNPFKVDTRGVVTYYGFMPQTGDGPKDHSWYIKTSGVSLDSGGHPNEAGDNRNAGIVNLKEDLPFSFSAKVQVSGSLTSDLPQCEGTGYVEFIGDGILGPLGILGLVLLGGGIGGLLFNARPATTFKG